MYEFGAGEIDHSRKHHLQEKNSEACHLNGEWLHPILAMRVCSTSSEQTSSRSEATFQKAH